MHCPDRVQQLFMKSVLQQISASPRLQRLDYLRIAGIRGQNDDSSIRDFLPNGHNRFGAPHIRHSKIH